MRRSVAAGAIFLLLPGCGGEAPRDESAPMTFFLTSAGLGDGADLGGLAGADAHCQGLAEAAGSERLVWRAYLSTTGEEGENARERIGAGPWWNAAGVRVADDVEHLHSDRNWLGKKHTLTERGDQVNGRGDTPNRHDILTGSLADGRASTAEDDTTCSNWTSNAPDGSALVGHHDKQGGGPDPKSWNSAHGSQGCGQEDLRATGGDGLFYCFAAGVQ